MASTVIVRILGSAAIIGLTAEVTNASVSLTTSAGILTAIYSEATDNYGNAYSSPEVFPNSLPYSAPLYCVANTSTCTVTPLLQTTGFSLGFSERLVDAECTTGGHAYLYFVAGPGTSYSLSGSLSYSGGEADASLGAVLQDVTTDATLYYFDGQPTYIPGFGYLPSPISLNTSGGSLDGSLDVGDTYLFLPVAEMNTLDAEDVSLTANVTISFTTVPEPDFIGTVAMVGAPLLRRRRRKAKVQR